MGILARIGFRLMEFGSWFVVLINNLIVVYAVHFVANRKSLRLLAGHFFVLAYLTT